MENTHLVAPHSTHFVLLGFVKEGFLKERKQTHVISVD